MIRQNHNYTRRPTRHDGRRPFSPCICQTAISGSKLCCMPVALSLEGKVALITGGSRGIGAAIVRMFVAAGARVFFSYEKAASAAEQLCQELGEESCAARSISLDGSPAAGDLVTACIAKFGRLDILVANHGVWPPEDIPVDKMADDQWRKTVAVNLDSVFGLVKHS